jgi:hypothetical protein
MCLIFICELRKLVNNINKLLTNKQSPESERQAKNEVLNSVLVEAEISYKDGTSHTDYYKLETIENGNSVNIFKLSE